MRQRRPGLMAIGSLCAVGSIAGALAQDPPAPEPWRNEITVDLGAAAFKTPLPFDVPFWIASDVDATVTSVAAAFKDKQDKLVKGCAFSADKPGCVPSCPSGKKYPVTDSDKTYFGPDCTNADDFEECVRGLRCDYWCPWQYTSGWSRTSFAGDKPRARVLVDRPLRPRRDFDFVFLVTRKLTKDERKKAEQLWAERFGEEFRNVPAAVTVDSLVEVVEDMLPAETVHGFPQRTDLELEGPPQATAAQIQDTLDLLVDAIEADDLRGQTLAELQSGTRELEQALHELFDLQPLESIGPHIQPDRAGASKDPALASLFAQYTAVTELLAAGQEREMVRPMALGSDVALPDPGDVPETAEVERRIASLDATRHRLSLLRRFAVSAAVLGYGWAGDLARAAEAASDESDIVRESLVALRYGLVERERTIEAAATTIKTRLLETIQVRGSTSADFATEHRWYIAADVGIAWAWDLDDVYPYAGTNIYFRPVNKQARFEDLRYEYGFWGSLCRRASVSIGVTTSDVGQTGRREGLIGESGVTLGLGLRFNQSMRLSVGALAFRGVDPNPLVSATAIEVSPFLSFSFDWDVRDTFGAIGDKLKLGK